MGLFDALLKKVRYTADAVNDVGEAVNEKGARINLFVTPLAEWPRLIRENIRVAGQPFGVTSLEVNKVSLANVADRISYDLPAPSSITVDAPTIDVTGTWVFNETLTNPSGLFYGSGRTTFTSDGTSFIGLSHAYPVLDTGHTAATAFGYYRTETTVVDAYRWGSGWTKQEYRTVTFGGEFPRMDRRLYAWFSANATKIS